MRHVFLALLVVIAAASSVGAATLKPWCVEAPPSVPSVVWHTPPPTTAAPATHPSGGMRLDAPLPARPVYYAPAPTMRRAPLRLAPVRRGGC